MGTIRLQIGGQYCPTGEFLAKQPETKKPWYLT